MPSIKKQLNQIIWEKWSKGKTPDIRPDGKDFVMDTMPFWATFKEKLTDDRPFQYGAEGRYISFKPAGIWWTTPQGQVSVKQGANPSVGNLTNGKVNYIGALGNGIDIEASVSRTTWRKEITINSLAALGGIPADAEFLEIAFELETDFDIEGWDKQSELKFTGELWLSKLSRLRSVNVRDSSRGEELDDPHLICDGFLRVQDGKYYLVKRIPADYLRRAVYPVTTDAVIAYGSEYEYNAGATSTQGVATLDSTHFVVAYEDAGDASHGKARIGIISSGDNIAYGDVYEFSASQVEDVRVEALDSTHFVIAYFDVGDSSKGKAVIGIVSGIPADDITYGDIYEFNVNLTDFLSCAGLDSTHFVVIYKDGGDTHSKAKVGVVSGTPQDDIAFGAEYEYSTDTIYDTQATKLDSTHFVIAFRDQTALSNKAVIGVVSAGDNITFGDEYVFNAGAGTPLGIGTLDSTHFVVGFPNTLDLLHGYAKVGVVSGTPQDDIAFGAAVEFNDGGYVGALDISGLDASHFVVAYKDDGGDNYGESRIGTVSGGDVIAFSAEATFNAANMYQTSTTALDSTHFVVAYVDAGDANHGKAIVGILIAGLENKSANMGSKMVAAGLI